MLDRLVQRVLEPCLVTRLQEVARRLLLVLGPQPVVREQTEHLGLTIRIPLLEPFCGAAVQPRPLLGEQRPVGRLLDERVPEPVFRLRPAPALPEQAEPLQLVQRVFRQLAEHALEQRQREGAPQRGRGGDELACRSRQPVEARKDRLLHGRRHLDLDCVIEAPAFVDANERSDVGKRADELLEEERVPLGGL